jgi:hypothetical protein
MGIKLNVQETIESACKQSVHEPDFSPALKTTGELLITLWLLPAQKWFPKNSRNRNTPPPAVPKWEKTSKAHGKRKPADKEGHPGTSLKPDKIVPLMGERSTLPPGGEWKAAGWEKRGQARKKYRQLVRRGGEQEGSTIYEQSSGTGFTDVFVHATLFALVLYRFRLNSY